MTFKFNLKGWLYVLIDIILTILIINQLPVIWSIILCIPIFSFIFIIIQVIDFLIMDYCRIKKLENK